MQLLLLLPIFRIRYVKPNRIENEMVKLYINARDCVVCVPKKVCSVRITWKIQTSNEEIEVFFFLIQDELKIILGFFMLHPCICGNARHLYLYVYVCEFVIVCVRECFCDWIANVRPIICCKEEKKNTSYTLNMATFIYNLFVQTSSHFTIWCMLVLVSNFMWS